MTRILLIAPNGADTVFERDRAGLRLVHLCGAPLANDGPLRTRGLSAVSTGAGPISPDGWRLMSVRRAPSRNWEWRTRTWRGHDIMTRGLNLPIPPTWLPARNAAAVAVIRAVRS